MEFAFRTWELDRVCFIGNVGSCLWLLIKFQPKKKVRKCKEMWCLILWDKENNGEFFKKKFKFT